MTVLKSETEILKMDEHNGISNKCYIMLLGIFVVFGILLAALLFTFFYNLIRLAQDENGIDWIQWHEHRSWDKKKEIKV